LEKPRFIEKRMQEKWEKWKQDQSIQVNDVSKIVATGNSEEVISMEISLVSSGKGNRMEKPGRSEMSVG
jgi:hypothetical protein